MIEQGHFVQLEILVFHKAPLYKPTFLVERKVSAQFDWLCT